MGYCALQQRQAERKLMISSKGLRDYLYNNGILNLYLATCTFVYFITFLGFRLKDLLILFSLELHDITQETEYVMNFWPMWPECLLESLTEVVYRGQHICNP